MDKWPKQHLPVPGNRKNREMNKWEERVREHSNSAKTKTTKITTSDTKKRKAKERGEERRRNEERIIVSIVFSYPGIARLQERPQQSYTI